jgi:uncharacterized protein (TIGR02996 family)
MTLDAFLQAMIADPLGAPTTWLVLADWLEDQGDPRAELVRLMYQPEYDRDMPATDRDDRVRELLASGVGPVTPTLVNSIGMRLVLIPAGTFQMGSPIQGQGNLRKDYGDDWGEWVDQETLHEVQITRPFLLGACPVTQQEYERVMGKNPSDFSHSGIGKNSVQKLDTKHFPVETVPWNDATVFCKALSNLPEEQAFGRTYRLPSEAEWEYACRGGAASYTPFHLGTSLCSTQANFNGDYPFGKAAKGPYLERPCAVRSYPANAFGLFDMHGNVWEWCLDWYDQNYYQSSPKKDPQGPDNGDRRVLRGGSWFYPAFYCRSGRRYYHAPVDRSNKIGFRVCCVLDF